MAHFNNQHIKENIESKIPSLHLVSVLWGENYIDLFCRITIKSLLAESNLPALVSKVKLHYFIYTTREAIESIQEKSSIILLISLKKLFGSFKS